MKYDEFEGKPQRWDQTLYKDQTSSPQCGHSSLMYDLKGVVNHSKIIDSSPDEILLRVDEINTHLNCVKTSGIFLLHPCFYFKQFAVVSVSFFFVRF